MLFCRAALPLSSRSLNFVARIIRRYRKEIGSLWQRLAPGQQALLVLACLTKGRDAPAGRGRVRRRDGHGWRYMNETVKGLGRLRCGGARRLRLHRRRPVTS
jgi:hypothetical protein